MEDKPHQKPRPTPVATSVRATTTREIQVLCTLQASTPTVPVFIVEEHSEALLCLQRSMRRGLLPMSGIQMIHYDAHPDLSIPQKLTPAVVYNPQELLETLRNTESGIAEWMMPLVYAGHVNRIVWVRPLWSTQLANGEYTIQVGDAVVEHTSPTAKYLVVDCKAPYFANDGMNSSISCLDNVQELSLHVVTSDLNPIHYLSTAPHTAANTAAAAAAANTATPHSSTPPTNNFVLDICLDYFSTLNPFLEQLNKANLPTESLHAVLSFCMEFAAHVDTNVGQWDQQTWEERVRRSMLEEFFRKKIYTWNQEEMLQHTTVALLISSGYHTKAVLIQFVNALLVVEEKEKEKEKEKERSSSSSTSSTTTTSTIELILEYCMWSDLPSHQSTRAEMVHELKRMQDQMLQWKIKPAAITIACSSEDGFIHNKDVKWLINQILNTLQTSLGSDLDIIPEHEVETLYGIGMGKWVEDKLGVKAGTGTGTAGTGTISTHWNSLFRIILHTIQLFFFCEYFKL